MPGAESATSSIAGQARINPQREQRCQTTARCFPLPPHCCSKSQTDPASKGDQHSWCFAESEVATPAPHIWSEFGYRLFDADTLCPSSNFSYSVLEAIQSLRRNDAPDLWTVAKTESEKLPLLRSRYRTLRLVHFEFELLRDESLHAFHHSLSRPFAANVDVAVVRVSNKTKTPTLQLPVEFVEHEIAEQRRKWTTLRSPLHARADQPVLHDSGIQECPDQFQQPLVFNALGNLPHQFVVLDSIEKFLQIEIDDPTITLRDVLLRLGYCLMSRSTWSKTVTVIGKGRVPPSLQNLHHRLLDESIQHSWNAELAHSSVRLRYFYPTDRLRFVGFTQQLFPNGWPVLFQVVDELTDGHPVDARTTFV